MLLLHPDQLTTMSFLIFNILFLVGAVVCDTYKDVTIDQGPVRGHLNEDDNLYAFYGIPYATAPEGEDKYKAALPPPTWTETFDATPTDVICHQMQTNIDEYYVQNRTFQCLNTNVFVPNTNETNLPVFVNIYGGGHQEGLGMLFNPGGFVQKGVIAVNFNYRVGIRGFLCLNTELAPGNAGLKDMVDALKWVQRNIAAFGGDPNNVMIAGSSSASAAVELLMMSELANGLFHKSSMEIGSSLNVPTYTPIQIAENFANLLGVSTNYNVTALDEFYRTLDEDGLNTGSYSAEIMFLPCPETHNLDGVEKFMSKAATEQIREGAYEKRPLLIGFALLEGLHNIAGFDASVSTYETNFSSVIPTYITFESEEEKENAAELLKDTYFPDGIIDMWGYAAYTGDMTFSYPISKSARLHAANGVPVHYYLFSYNGTVNLPQAQHLEIMAPAHIAETMYLQEYLYPGVYDEMTANDYYVQNMLRDMWINFAKNSNPLPDDESGVEWDTLVAEESNYLNIDLELSSGYEPLKANIDAWDEVTGFELY